MRIADALLDAFEAAIARACEAPDSCSVLVASKGRTFRSTRLRRFPYRLIFIVCNDGVRILALAHVRRKPGYWKWRLSRG